MACIAGVATERRSIDAAEIGQDARLRSVLEGVFSAGQAARGQSAYLDECARCHSSTLTGTEQGPALIGKEFIVTWNGMTLAELFVRIRDEMPLDSPGRLTPQQTTDIIAFILKTNDFPHGTMPLTTDVASLKSIRIERPPANQR